MAQSNKLRKDIVKRKKLISKKHNFKKKILISLCSFLFFLCLIEAGLRIAGYIYLLRTPPSTKAKDTHYDFGNRSADSGYAILCVGDSFTRGGKYSNESYPAQLAGKIAVNNADSKFVVINQGVCEYNSRQVIESLPLWIKVYRPQTIILLVGAANRFNPYGYSFSSNKGALFFNKMIYGLRIFKMMKIIVLNLKARGIKGYVLVKNKGFFMPGHKQRYTTRYDKARIYIEKMDKVNTPPLDNNKFDSAWFCCNNNDLRRALQLIKEYIGQNGKDEQAFCSMAYFHYKLGNYQDGSESYSAAFKINPRSESVLCQAAFFYKSMGDIFIEQGKYGLAIEYLLKAIEVDPANQYNYYLMTKVYDLQSRYDSDYIVNTLQNILNNNPGLDNNLTMNYINLFKNKQNYEEKINKWLRDDLKEIAVLCRENRIGLVLQNYPISYSMANGIIKEIVYEYSLPFVDNCSVFNKLIADEGKDSYLRDDEHCTNQGYGIMAENIYEVLFKEGVISDLQKSQL